MAETTGIVWQRGWGGVRAGLAEQHSTVENVDENRTKSSGWENELNCLCLKKYIWILYVVNYNLEAPVRLTTVSLSRNACRKLVLMLIGVSIDACLIHVILINHFNYYPGDPADKSLMILTAKKHLIY